MLKIMYFFVKENIVCYIITAVLFLFLFFFTGMYLDEYIIIGTELSYIHTLEDSLMLYTLNAVGEGSGWDCKDSRRGEHAGYTRMAIVNNDDTRNSNACFAVDSFIGRHFLFHVRGRELSFEDGENEVILYGEMLRQRYKMGDMVSLNGEKYKVVGYLPAYEPIWDFNKNVSEDGEVDVLAYALNGNMYFINNEKAFTESSSKVQSCVFADHDIPGWRKGSSMKKMKKAMTGYRKGQQVFEAAGIAMLTGIAIYLCIATAIIQYTRCRSMYAIFWICGMHFVKYYLLCVLHSVLAVSVSVFFYYMIYWIAVHREHIDIRLENIRLCFVGGVSVVLMLISVLLNSFLNRNTVTKCD